MIAWMLKNALVRFLTEIPGAFVKSSARALENSCTTRGRLTYHYNSHSGVFDISGVANLLCIVARQSLECIVHF